MSNEDQTSWLFGLEKFFEFTGHRDKKELVKNMIRMIHSNEKDKIWALKNCIANDYEKFGTENRELRLGLYVELLQQQRIDHKSLFWLMNDIWADDFSNKLHLFFNNSDINTANDLFSKSQVLSKIWMAEILQKFMPNLGNIALFGGWYAQHMYYLDNLNFKQVLNIDLDSEVLVKSNNILGSPSNYKTLTADVNYVLHEGKIFIDGTAFDPDLVINTSAEHMSTEWFDKLSLGQMVLIQTNDMQDMQGHVNCCSSLEEVKLKYKLRQVLFAGELTLSKGCRFMLFGIK
jgi:hypothetical protein